MNGEPSTLISPGIWGFLAFFVLAVALYLLMRNMNARMRRMSYRAEELQRRAEAEGKTGTEADTPEADDEPGSDGQTGNPSP
ncbi:hypothetical protein [Nostocoides sp. HKS02]|uniref:hypothetical protein n=1 Tax=Nostocoides sp. HKS02 TaxID=1813880 RepID=UPI0012B4668B|nr:hypothetical protein [Tetrasphaera sp. HKS02]QGN59177.1 hypothetical protein GKE56_16245 [Tetrasphaera sp. HKS02]